MQLATESCNPAYQLVIMGAEEPKLDVDSYEEQFYASTEEKESVARPSVHSQTTLVQGQRSELDSCSGVLGLRENKKGLPADRLVVKLESTTDRWHT